MATSYWREFYYNVLSCTGKKRIFNQHRSCFIKSKTNSPIVEELNVDRLISRT